ncbi:hypothetical protein H6P81_005772 [Aristolochia fimbriata]|uniref:Uncharacterized protein n=1 Tax=Aristolochia fimbriata TaxID=158543 RepID=A0AAV7EZY9_ARIFI|nr:hypothetical protein H6P81_005772 [Aristolochia fimbriata]
MNLAHGNTKQSTSKKKHVPVLRSQNRGAPSRAERRNGSEIQKTKKLGTETGAKKYLIPSPNQIYLPPRGERALLVDRRFPPSPQSIAHSAPVLTEILPPTPGKP